MAFGESGSGVNWPLWIIFVFLTGSTSPLTAFDNVAVSLNTGEELLNNRLMAWIWCE